MTRCLLCAWGLLLLAGCGQSLPCGEVEGTLRVGGQPLEKILVTFVPDPAQGTSGITTWGLTDAEGKFRLQSGEGAGAVPVGWHRVTLQDLELNYLPRDERAPPSGAPVRARVASPYRGTGSTPLRREVRAGPQTIELEID